MKHMVVDCSNLFWRAVSAQQKYGPPDAKDSAGLGLHMSLMSLKKYYNSVKPNKVAVVFEGKANWRKEFTRSAECYSKRLYKGNRIADPNMAVLFEVITAFEEMSRDFTSLTTLSHPQLEGDDLISGYAQHFTALGDEVVILSGDKDFAQELRNPLVTLLDPHSGKPRTLVDVCGVNDAGYFMFEKAFRGDGGDNVLPAFPKVRKTRLHKAYGVIDGKVDPAKADSFELSNLLDSTWDFVDPESGDKRIMSEMKMFEENNTLMNLQEQPENIRALINEVIMSETEKRGQFNFFKFSKFLGQHQLVELAEKASDFAPLFSGTGFPAKTEKKPAVVEGLQF